MRVWLWSAIARLRWREVGVGGEEKRGSRVWGKKKKKEGEEEEVKKRSDGEFKKDRETRKQIKRKGQGSLIGWRLELSSMSHSTTKCVCPHDGV